MRSIVFSRWLPLLPLLLATARGPELVASEASPYRSPLALRSARDRADLDRRRNDIDRYLWNDSSKAEE